MNNYNICALPNRKLVRVGGEEAEAFLQNILTCNLERINEGEAGFGGLLTPQGKILFDFFIIRQNSEFLIDVISELAEELVKRLTFYRLRAPVTIDLLGPEWKVFAKLDQAQQSLSDEAIIRVRDPRLKEMGWRIYTDQPNNIQTDAEPDDYELHRLNLGIPEGGTDYQYGDAFPHEVLYDQMNGVDFAKGCYVGQEVVSRMHHRGTARKRIVQISSAQDLPDTGTKITVDGRSIGTITSSKGQAGLAMIRLDHAGDALTQNKSFEAETIRLIPAIQSWAGFEWQSSDR